MSKLDLLGDLRERYGTKAVTPVVTPADDQVSVEKAFVVHADSGRTVITAPLREIAMTNPGFMYLRGRFVGADTPNGNGALWSSDDLRLGENTVAGGPLNWLHDETHIIGCLTDGQLVGAEKAAEGVNAHLSATAAVWRFLFPREAQTIEKAANDGELYYSMECISREVACVDTPGRPGCGETFSYGDYDAGKCCTHLRERSAVRQFVDPIFLGGAVVVPPIRPGWHQANAEVLRQAASLAEENGLAAGNRTQEQAMGLATAVLAWANRD
jgi:hypothetical protein